MIENISIQVLLLLCNNKDLGTESPKGLPAVGYSVMNISLAGLWRDMFICCLQFVISKYYLQATNIIMQHAGFVILLLLLLLLPLLLIGKIYILKMRHSTFTPLREFWECTKTFEVRKVEVRTTTTRTTVSDIIIITLTHGHLGFIISAWGTCQCSVSNTQMRLGYRTTLAGPSCTDDNYYNNNKPQVPMHWHP